MVPSAHTLLNSCLQFTWRKTWVALLHTNTGNHRSANHRHTPPPQYLVSQKVWLSMRDLSVWGECYKLAPRIYGVLSNIQGHQSCCLCLQLPQTTRVHSTFHVSWLKPAKTSHLDHYLI